MAHIYIYILFYSHKQGLKLNFTPDAAVEMEYSTPEAANEIHRSLFVTEPGT